jgi:hypothetical protein
LSSSGWASSLSQSSCSERPQRGFGILSFGSLVAFLKVKVAGDQIQLSDQHLHYPVRVLANRTGLVEQQAYLLAKIVCRLTSRMTA